jgi:hypothetical protein
MAKIGENEMFLSLILFLLKITKSLTKYIQNDLFLFLTTTIVFAGY